MALVLEDGSGLAGAESYASVNEATAYYAARNKGDDWDAVEDKEAALRNATDYLTAAYNGKWAGTRVNSVQALDWPRIDVPWPDSPLGYYPSNSLPQALKRACIELALRAEAAPLLADEGRETVSETVDVVSVTYAEGKSQQTKYTMVASLLRPLLVGGGSMIPMERS